MKKFKGLQGIEDHLASMGNGFPIEVTELDHIVDAIVAYCDVTREQGTRILCLFFQEIRSAMLKGEIININGLGMFFISSPATTKNLERVFAKFKPNRSFIKRIKSNVRTE